MYVYYYYKIIIYLFSFSSSQLENSCLDSQSMIATDNPFYIRKLVKKNFSAITSSTNTLLASTQHYTYRDFFSQVFNKDKIEVQTALSSKISMILIVLIGW